MNVGLDDDFYETEIITFNIVFNQTLFSFRTNTSEPGGEKRCKWSLNRNFKTSHVKIWVSTLID